MGDYADDALDREMEQWNEETRPIYEGEEVCPNCSRSLCICNEHPNEI